MKYLALLAPFALVASAPAGATPVQKVTIVVDNGFKPATVSVKAGQPVQITFVTKHRGCASSVIFEGLNLSKPLKDGTKTVVTFTPKKAGTIAYACPMKMMNGKIAVK